MGRDKAKTKKAFELTKAQAGFFIWGSFGIRQNILDRAGFDTLENALQFYFKHRDDILKKMEQMGQREDSVDEEWQRIAFDTFCGGRFCGKGCKTYQGKPRDRHEPWDEPWVDGDPDSFPLYGK